jgi:alpha-tubulin suppressor-like RCC1 family protein
MHRSIKHAAQAAFIVLMSSACSNVDAPTASPVVGDASTGLIPIPRPPIDKTGFVDISAGSGFTCARRANGPVYCWGRNNHAQSGSPNVADVVRPRLITKPDGSSLLAVQIDVGIAHACALEASGLAWCWGDGNSGQVGRRLGETSDYMPDTVAGGFRYTSISAGSNATCATSDSGFFCWGGGVGQGHTVPNRLSTFNRYAGVAVGEMHACAMDKLDPNRTVDCFGSNFDGQTGLPTSFVQVPFTLRAQFGTPILRVTTQGRFTCVDQSAGTVQCVGLNSWGQLGNGHHSPTNGVPTNVSPAQQLRGVSVGTNHACALAPDNTARCWGYGFDGQLGNGVLNAAFETPQTVIGNYTYRAIATGNQHSCAIGTDGLIYCWGYNQYGALGRGFADLYAYSPPAPTAP